MRRSLLALGLLVGGAGAAKAQEFRFLPFAQPELRLESTVGEATELLAGAGFNVPAGYYVRIAPGLALGRELASEGNGVARAEVVARFLTDPFHERRWNAYGGGGAGVVWREGEPGRAVLLLVAGVDFPGRSGWHPALEAAMGDGVRVAVVFRHARRSGR
jgi:hypothetical protein